MPLNPGRRGGPRRGAVGQYPETPVVGSVSISTPPDTTIEVSDTVQLTAVVISADTKSQGLPGVITRILLTDRVVAWASSAPSVATVDSTGLVTGVSAGSANITASSEGATSAPLLIAITSPAPVVATVEVTPASFTVFVGSIRQLVATPKDSGGLAIAGLSTTWGSATPGTATVDSSGLVTGVAVGTVTITATVSAINGTSACAVAAVLVDRAVAPIYTLPTGLTYDPGTDTIVGTVYALADTVPTFSGTVRTVTDQGSVAANQSALQTQINAAGDLDDIVLTAGVDYGKVTLPARAGSNFIRLRTNSLGSLPSYGNRVSAATHASAMPKVTAQANAGKAMDAVYGAGGWWITGVEFTQKTTVTTYNLIYFGFDTPGARSTWVEDIVLDRCLIRPPPTYEGKAAFGVRFDVTGGAIIGCAISGLYAASSENKDILIVNSEGRLRIENNYLDAAGVNTMIGGADINVSPLLPRDVHFKKNWHFCPLGKSWAKNVIEFKYGERILVEQSVFENAYPAGQNGYADVVKAVNQNGGMTWVATHDITYRQNLYLNVFAGVTLAGAPESATVAKATGRIDYHQNVFVGKWDGVTSEANRTVVLLANHGTTTAKQLRDIRFMQNTSLGEFQKVILFAGATDAKDVVFTKNVFQLGGNAATFRGVNGDGSQQPSGVNQGEPLFADYTTGTSSITGNVLYANTAMTQSTLNAFSNNTMLPNTAESAMIVSWNAGDPMAGDFAIIHASASTQGAPWNRMSQVLLAVRS